MKNRKKRVHATVGICWLKIGGRAAMVYGSMMLIWKVVVVSHTYATV
jgi:hypothetical protein